MALHESAATVQAAVKKPAAASSGVSRRAAAAPPAPAASRALPAPASTAVPSRGAGAKAWGPPTRSTRGLGGDAMASNIAQLKEMGFGEEQARQALKECTWDVNKALDLLVTRAAAGGAVQAEGAEREDSSAREVSVRSLPAQSSKDLERAAHAESGTRLADSENSTTASTASSPRGSWRSSAGSPQQAEASQGREAESPSSCMAVSKSQDKDLRKPIRRVCRSWNSQEEAHFRAGEGDFVRVWPRTETELGWIYAEHPSDDAVSGWLPVIVLEALSAEECWMMVQKTMAASFDGQLSVKDGEFLKVMPSSRTEQGWAYAARAAHPGQCVDVAGVGSMESTQAGWVPVCSLRWEDAEE
eukprot:gb/GFBE01010450.1/.p1 GENE.gb/GFBE01010450.1/~~gb/GFBE01010450.1/.p1  ORF type:complete len:358 (+),score=54.65 gb/GFBE01010450.1/:1-1074(+)